MNDKITKADIEFLSNELADFQQLFYPHFKRREQYERADNYLAGLIQPLPNKAIETMQLHMQDDDPKEIRAMQHFISEGAWDDLAVLQEAWKVVDEEIGDVNGVLIVDGSDFPKQGKHSAGVKRQYCGQLGKTANCQAGVFLGYTSDKGYTLLDHRLYLPQEWLTDNDYAHKRQKCRIPEATVFQTKPQLAAEMILAQARAGKVRYRWLTCDEAFGCSTVFLDKIAPIVTYFAEVPQDTHIWLERPQMSIPAYSGKGRKPIHKKIVEGEPHSQMVSSVLETLNADQWQRLLVKEGTKQTIMADFACLRVVNRRKTHPQDDVWLVIRRDIESNNYHFYLSNAPIETKPKEFAKLSGQRWPIETCFEEGKQELGMGDYQVRTWTGWHHHMTLVILAHIFLMRVQRRLEDKTPQITLPQAILLLKATLPQPDYSVERTIDIVNYYQVRHEQARKSHRKRKASNSEVSL